MEHSHNSQNIRYIDRRGISFVHKLIEYDKPFAIAAVLKRVPLGTFTGKDLESGWNILHLGIYTKNLVAILVLLKSIYAATPSESGKGSGKQSMKVSAPSIDQRLLDDHDNELLTPMQLLSVVNNLAQLQLLRKYWQDQLDGTSPSPVPTPVSTVSYGVNPCVVPAAVGGLEVFALGQCNHLFQAYTRTARAYRTATTVPFRLPMEEGSELGLGTGTAVLVRVATSNYHCVGITATGALYCWGSNKLGQCGLPVERSSSGSGYAAVATPTLVELFSPPRSRPRAGSGAGVGDSPTTAALPAALRVRACVRQAALSDGHTMLLTAEGEVYTCGSNTHGQLGHSPACPSLGEVRSVAALRGRVVVAIAAGVSHSICADIHGTVYGWGCNQRGQLGPTTRVSVDATSSLEPNCYWQPQTVKLGPLAPETRIVQLVATEAASIILADAPTASAVLECGNCPITITAPGCRPPRSGPFRVMVVHKYQGASCFHASNSGHLAVVQVSAAADWHLALLSDGRVFRWHTTGNSGITGVGVDCPGAGPASAEVGAETGYPVCTGSGDPNEHFRRCSQDCIELAGAGRAAPHLILYNLEFQREQLEVGRRDPTPRLRLRLPPGARIATIAGGGERVMCSTASGNLYCVNLGVAVAVAAIVRVVGVQQVAQLAVADSHTFIGCAVHWPQPPSLPAAADSAPQQEDEEKGKSAPKSESESESGSGSGSGSGSELEPVPSLKTLCELYIVQHSISLTRANMSVKSPEGAAATVRLSTVLQQLHFASCYNARILFEFCRDFIMMNLELVLIYYDLDQVLEVLLLELNEDEDGEGEGGEENDILGSETEADSSVARGSGYTHSRSSCIGGSVSVREEVRSPLCNQEDAVGGKAGAAVTAEKVDPSAVPNRRRKGAVPSKTGDKPRPLSGPGKDSPGSTAKTEAKVEATSATVEHPGSHKAGSPAVLAEEASSPSPTPFTASAVPVGKAFKKKKFVPLSSFQQPATTVPARATGPQQSFAWGAEVAAKPSVPVATDLFCSGGPKITPSTGAAVLPPGLGLGGSTGSGFSLFDFMKPASGPTRATAPAAISSPWVAALPTQTARVSTSSAACSDSPSPSLAQIQEEEARRREVSLLKEFSGNLNTPWLLERRTRALSMEDIMREEEAMETIIGDIQASEAKEARSDAGAGAGAGAGAKSRGKKEGGRGTVVGKARGAASGVTGAVQLQVPHKGSGQTADKKNPVNKKNTCTGTGSGSHGASRSGKPVRGAKTEAK